MFGIKMIPKKNRNLRDISSHLLAEAIIGEMNSGTVSDFKTLKKTNRGQCIMISELAVFLGLFSCRGKVLVALYNRDIK